MKKHELELGEVPLILGSHSRIRKRDGGDVLSILLAERVERVIRPRDDLPL